MVGGSRPAFERVRPLFEVMGKNIVHVGDSGAGQVCKACNQVVISQTIAGVGEAMLLAKASGVDGAKVREALLGGWDNSRVLELHRVSACSTITMTPASSACCSRKTCG